MKKLILILVLAFTVQVSFSQTKIDFFDFVRNFDWSISESDFQSKYKDRIIDSDDTELIHLSGICFEQRDAEVVVRFDEQTKEVAISLVLVNLEEADQSELKKFLKRKFGEPTFILHDGVTINKQDAKILNLGLDYERIWVTDKYVYTWYTLENSGQTFMFFVVQNREPDFRKGYWGDSKDEIKKREGKPDESVNDNIYSFETSIAGIGRCSAVYRFTNNELTSGKYIFLDINSDNCVRNYEKLVDLLTVKYGEPGSNERKSTGWLESDMLSDEALVTAGQLRFETMWYTPATMLGIFLYGEQYTPWLVIEYYSVLHQEEMEHDVLKDL